MAVEDRLRAQGVKVEGAFNTERFFDTIARVLSRRYRMEVTINLLDSYESPETEPYREES